jgi:isopenicillin-N epimerase
MSNDTSRPFGDFDRRRFLTNAGRGLGLATLSSSALLGAMLEGIRDAAARAPASPAAAADDEDFWFEIQRAFAVGRGLCNLNNGGVSPSPRLVTDALIRYQWMQEDATAYTLWQVLEPQTETVRAGLAELFGCDAEEIAITRNASESLEAALFGLDLKPGDEILTTTQDYPRMLTTLRQRQRREGVVLKTIRIPIPARQPSEIVAAFEAALTPRTQAILISHVINITGQIVPVKAICDLARPRGIAVIVDGAHSFAHLDFKRDDLGCDYFGTSLHKWLMAPKGTGLLYVKRDKIKSLWPLLAANEKQDADIRKFEETGTRSAAPRLAIGEAILFHLGIGAARKEARMRYLARRWMTQLAGLPRVRFHTPDDDIQACGIGTVQIEGVDVGALATWLQKEKRILVAAINHDEFQGIRVTPNVYTTLDDLDRFCEIMAGVAKNGLPT